MRCDRCGLAWAEHNDVDHEFTQTTACQCCGEQRPVRVISGMYIMECPNAPPDTLTGFGLYGVRRAAVCFHCDNAIDPADTQWTSANGVAWHWRCGQREESLF